MHNPIKNKYYLWYLSICQNQRKKTKGLVCHHIIPASFFKENDRRVNNGWLDGNPNDKGNLTYLTEREHFIVHWLLCYCYEGLAKEKMIHAFMLMSSNNPIGSRYYQYARDLLKKSSIGKGNVSWKGGKICKICPMCQSQFESFPSQNRKYCSNICRGKGRNIKGSNHPRYIIGPKENICENCSNVFWSKQSSKARFCSNACKNLGHSIDHKNWHQKRKLALNTLQVIVEES